MSGSLRLCLCPVTGREWCMPAYSSSAAWITHTHLTTVSAPYCSLHQTSSTTGRPSSSSSSPCVVWIPMLFIIIITIMNIIGLNPAHTHAERASKAMDAENHVKFYRGPRQLFVALILFELESISCVLGLLMALLNKVSLCFQCKKDFKYSWNICRPW